MFLSRYYAALMFCINVFMCLSCKLYSVSHDSKHHCYDGVAIQLFRSRLRNVCILSLYIKYGILLNADIEIVSN